MFIAHRLSTNPDAVTGVFRRAATILAIGFALLAAVPGTAHGEDDPITISWGRAEDSVHEGALLGFRSFSATSCRKK